MGYHGLAAVFLLVVLPNVHPMRRNTQQDNLHKYPGEDITLDCAFSKAGYNVFYYPVVWYKVVDGDLVQINDNAILKSPFVETGRYSMQPNISQPDWVSMPLTIKNMNVADDGSYICKMNGDDVPSPKQYTVIVPERVQSLEIKTNKTVSADNGSKKVFEFQDLNPSYLSCQSMGGNPRPELKMFRGDLEITSEFELTVNEDRSGPKGLETITYKLDLTKKDFRPTHDQSGEKLKCVAKLHRLPEFKQTVNGVMDVRYAPKFDCEPSRYLDLPIDMANYVIDCVIKGNPPVPASDVFWTFESNSTTTNLTVGQMNNDYSVEAKVTDDGYLNVTLRIKNVTTTHFNTYHIQAKNEIKEEHYEIVFGQATTSTTTTTTPKPAIEIGDGKGPQQSISSENGVSRVGVAWSHVAAYAIIGLVFGSRSLIRQR